MEQYVLSLVGDSSTSYKMYKGTTPLTDAELTSLFSTAGSAFFAFAFGSWTPSATDTVQIINSSDTVVMENTGLTDAITESKNYKVTWSANATTFDSFTELSGKALDESQLSFLMNKIKTNTTALDDVAYVDDTIGTQTNEAYVGTNNIQDGAVTTAKIANLNITTDKIASGAVTADKVDFATFAQFGTEQVIGTWTNGKPLYRKLIFLSAFPNSTSIQLNIDGGRRVEPVKVEAHIVSKSASSMTNYAPVLPYYNPGSGNYAFIAYSEYLVHIASNFDLSAFQGVIEVHYWKQSD